MFICIMYCLLSIQIGLIYGIVLKEITFYRRQQNYMDILKGLNLGHKTAYDLTNQFHHVFWFGDLNYRIDMPYEVS